MEDEYYKTKKLIFDDVDLTRLDSTQMDLLWEDIRKIVVGCEKNQFVGKDSYSGGLDDFNYDIDIRATKAGILTLKITGYDPL